MEFVKRPPISSIPEDEKLNGHKRRNAMRKITALFAGLMLIGATSVCYADLVSDSSARVHVKVDPDIAVSAINSNVDMGSIQRGIITGKVDFRVDANKQYVAISVAASPLFKGDDPLYAGSDAVAPIDLVGEATIAPDNGTEPISGANSVKVPLTKIGTIGNFPSLGSSDTTFESAANGHFSQVVHTTFQWNQNQLEKPAGDYSGKVKLVATVLP